MTSSHRDRVPPAVAADPPLTDHAAYVLSQLGRLSRNAVTQRLAEHDLTMRDMAALAVLGQSGAVTHAELGRRLGLDPSDVTALVDQLREAGRVEQTVDPADRRRRLVRSTRRGAAASRLARRITSRVDDELFAPLSPELRTEVHRALQVLLANARATTGK